MTTAAVPAAGGWHEMTAEQAVQALGTSLLGLSSVEAVRRLATHGPNVLPEASRRSPVRMLLAQFTDFMILVLLVAAAVSGVIGEAADALAIVAILVLNAVIGFTQDYRAEKALAGLKAMAAPVARVKRDGAVVTVRAADVVPGDVVLLEAGGIVPADARLVEAPQLTLDESALTGESLPVDKATRPVGGGDVALGDRMNMVYRGTVVTRGRGAAAVVATGLATELGRIASLLESTAEGRTPLQKSLADLGRKLAAVALVLCAIVFLAGLLSGEPPILMFLTAVSLAVAAIPEALPAVVTIALALGARRMVRKNALIRKLPAVEALGSVTYVCADKTGTLTANRMRVEGA